MKHLLSRNTNRIFTGMPRLVLTVTFASLWLVPLVFSFLFSLRPSIEPITAGNVFFGSYLTLENYRFASSVAPWAVHYRNSATIVFGVLLVQFVTITFAGYAFARLHFPGRSFFLFVVLVQMMVPNDVLLVQNFAMIRRLGLFDTRLAVMIPYWGSALGTLLIRQAFSEVPVDFEDAARIDGANPFQRIRHVYVPLSLPTYVAFALVSVSFHWNSFLWPLIVVRSESIRPVTVALNLLLQTADVGARYQPLMAGTFIVIGPLIVVFTLFQRYFIESFAHSGLR
jgi:sn-glycerol 3-phosphate transport system permease protein